MAHAINHSDRKGRIERPFSYVENNFLAGRTFTDWADLNAQARSLVRAGRQCQGQTHPRHEPAGGLRHGEGPPAGAARLHIPPVTEIHYRVVDSYGFVHLDTNRYSVPERWVGKKVAVHKRPEQVLVYADRQLLAEHPRLIGQRQGEQRAKGHHTQLERRRPPARSFPSGAGPHGA